MYQKTILLLAALFLATTLCCCFPTEKRSAKSALSKSAELSGTADAASVAVIPSRIDEKLDENITLAADVSSFEQREIQSVFLSLKMLDANQAASVLLGDEIVADTQEHTENQQPIVVLAGAKGSSLSVSPGSLYFERESFCKDKGFSSIIFNANGFCDLDALKTQYQKDTLDTVDRQESQAAVHSALESLGLTNLSEPEVIALDATTMASQFSVPEEDNPKKSTLKNFDEGDAGYLFVYGAEVNGIPMTKTSYLEAGGTGVCYGTRIYALVTANGLIMLRCEGLYDFGTTEATITAPSSFAQVLAALKFKFEDTLLDGPVIIEKIDLQYVPVHAGDNPLHFTLSPYWVCFASHTQLINDVKGSYEYTEKFPIYISYESATELSTGGTA